MSIDPRKSIVFTSAATFVLQLSVAIAFCIFAFYIAPVLEFETGNRSLSVSFPTMLEPVLLAFFVACFLAAAIVGWRAWLLYIGPWWRRNHGA